MGRGGTLEWWLSLSNKPRRHPQHSEPLKDSETLPGSCLKPPQSLPGRDPIAFSCRGKRGVGGFLETTKAGGSLKRKAAPNVAWLVLELLL